MTRRHLAQSGRQAGNRASMSMLQSVLMRLGRGCCHRSKLLPVSSRCSCRHCRRWAALSTRLRPLLPPAAGACTAAPSACWVAKSLPAFAGPDKRPPGGGGARPMIVLLLVPSCIEHVGPDPSPARGFQHVRTHACVESCLVTGWGSIRSARPHRGSRKGAPGLINVATLQVTLLPATPRAPPTAVGLQAPPQREGRSLEAARVGLAAYIAWLHLQCTQRRK